MFIFFALSAPAQVYNLEESTVQESRRVIDEKIAQLEQSIVQLKSRRNELAPISRLPPEILGSIFARIVAAAGQPYHVRLITAAVNFTYVCGLWRSVALNTPSIWCSIPFRNREWANAMLERSRKLDLLVNEDFNRATDTSPHVLSVKEVLNNHTARIRRLCLTGVSSSTLPVLLADLQPCSLRLRTLCLTGDHYAGGPVFPTGLISDSGMLLDLDVTNCGIAWFSLRFAGLTSLRIHKTPNRPCWTNFVTVLQSIPALEILDMEDSLPLSRGAYPRDAGAQTIKLMHLQKLSLCSTTSMREISNILSLIIVPPSANLEFRCLIDTIHDPDMTGSLSDFASSLSIFFSGMDSEQLEKIFYQQLRVRSLVDGALDIATWKDNRKLNSTRHTESTNLKLIIDVPGPVDRVVQEIIPVLPIAKLVTFILDIYLNENILVETFGSLPQLQNITSVGECTNNLLKALMHKPSDPLASQSISFPSLQSMEITDVIFSPAHHLRGGFSVDCLQDCLKERRDRYAQIRKLALANCFFLCECHVADLEEIVPEVDWDGYEQDYESSEEEKEDSYVYPRPSYNSYCDWRDDW